MKNNFDIEKLRNNFEKSLENFQTVRDVAKPYSVVLQAAILGLFECCCDCSYILMKVLLTCHGYFFPVTASPKMLAEYAFDCGLVPDADAWLNVFETKNLLAYTYDENDMRSVLDKFKEKYIPAFEKLRQSIDENWLNA